MLKLKIMYLCKIMNKKIMTNIEFLIGTKKFKKKGIIVKKNKENKKFKFISFSKISNFNFEFIFSDIFFPNK